MTDVIVTITGSLGGDPELRYTQNGVPVVNFNVAVTERKKDGDQWIDGDTTWFRVSAWRQLAENAAASLAKGQQVIVQGRMVNRTYEKDGQTRTALELRADAIGASLQFGTAQFTKGSAGPQAGQTPWDQPQQQGWSQPAQGQMPPQQGQPPQGWAGPNSGFVPPYAQGSPVPPPQAGQQGWGPAQGYGDDTPF